MKTYNIFTALLVFFVASSAWSQASIEFEKPIHDFGGVIEGEKPTFNFVFENTSDDTLVLEKVKPSCGCTSPFWTKEPVPPGHQGSIRVSYNSKGRPGPFYKTVTITANTSSPTTQIKIKGIVDKPADTSYSEVAKSNSPVLLFSKQVVNFGKIEVNKPSSVKLKYTNTGKSDLKISSLKAGCKCVSFQSGKDIVKPGESSTIELTYTPRDQGAVNENTNVYSNDLNTPVQTLEIKADVVKSLMAPSMMHQSQSFGF